VHTAPAHGTDDYLIGKVYGLPVNNPVGDDGRFVAGTPALTVGELAGKSVWEANPLVLQELAAKRPPAQGREDPAQLPALLAPQDADHFPRHDAVVRRHGAACGSSRRLAGGGPATARPQREARACAGAPNAPSTKRSSSRPGVARASKR
jgi:hypothetical protein